MLWKFKNPGEHRGVLPLCVCLFPGKSGYCHKLEIMQPLEQLGVSVSMRQTQSFLSEIHGLIIAPQGLWCRGCALNDLLLFHGSPGRQWNIFIFQMKTINSPGQESDHSPNQTLALFPMGHLAQTWSYPTIALSA